MVKHTTLRIYQISFEHMHDTLDHLFFKKSVLHLWELDYLWDQMGKVALSFLWYHLNMLQTTECDLNHILIQQQMRRLLIGEDEHEWLDKGVSEGVELLHEFVFVDAVDDFEVCH